jgi:Ca-activated chloride channel family protein
MKFAWPEMLWLLLAAPVLVGVYLLALRRRKRAVITYASVSLLRAAMLPGRNLRRHLPPALFLLAIVAAIIAIARPSAHITLPSTQQTIILAIDVSLSMGADDVDPNRLTAAQVAARAFVQEHPSDARIGIVAFGGSAMLVQSPTSNKEELIAAIDRFQLQRGTATGSALYTSLVALVPDAQLDPLLLDAAARGFGAGPRETIKDQPRKAERKSDAKAFTPARPGSFKSGAIILLSDGRRTNGPNPLEAARAVAERGVRVFTVGFGTKEGAMVHGDGWSIFVRLDEETLKAIADITQGSYFHAGTAADLKEVYQELNSRLVMERQDIEIGFLFAAIAVALLLAAALLSVLWVSPVLRTI